MSKKCLQIKNKGSSWKLSMIGLQKLLRLDSSPPRFLNGQKSLAWLGLIIVPTARQGRSQGENGNVDRFLMPRDSFTFRGRNEEGQLSNRAEHLSARAKQGKTAQRSSTVLQSGDQGKGNFLKAEEMVWVYGFSPGDCPLSSPRMYFSFLLDPCSTSVLEWLTYCEYTLGQCFKEPLSFEVFRSSTENSRP